MCFVSRAGAYRAFKQLFVDQPNLVSTISASDLPESFRLTVAKYADAQAIRRTTRHLHGVQSVEMAPSPAAVRRLPRRLREMATHRSRSQLSTDCTPELTHFAPR